MTRYIVMDRSAKMPTKVRSPYRRLAVVETDLPVGEEPKFIGVRARGLVRIVETWEKLNVGLRKRSAYVRAWEEAAALAAKLNADG